MFFDEKHTKVDKVSFGYIQIGTIKTSFTFKLEKKEIAFDFTNPRALFGIGWILYPFV